jgi:hypothetical protein
MLLQKLWMKRIMQNLFALNAFLAYCQNWDEYVQAGIKT